MTDAQESPQAVPWKIADLPEPYVRTMIHAVVGIEIPVERIEGKWKVSQNRSPADRLGVAAGLLGRGDEASRRMAEIVRRHAPPDV